MKSSKSAQIEVSFNWIFVLIAGAAILFFFIRVIGSETEFAESASHARAVSRMNSVITALKQNPDSVSVQDRLNFEIEFECTVEGQSYGIRNSNARETLPHEIVFTPQKIGSSRLVAWVKTFNAPFPVSSTLYLTDEQTKYVFLTDGDANNRVSYFYNQFPRNISKELTTLLEFKQRGDEGYREYILIISEDQADQNFGFSTDDRRALASKINSVIYIDENTNEIVFHELKNDLNYLDVTPSRKQYFTEESIIGAIISGNPELYECAMNKVLDHIKISAEINLERIKKIRTAYGSDHSCYSMYSPTIAQDFFENLAQASQNKNYENIRQHARSIEALNNQLRRSPCIQIY